MNTITENIVLDVNRSNLTTHIYAKQEDNVSREILITLTEDGRRLSPETGSSAILRATKPDGTRILNNATINTDGTVSVTLTDQILAAEGTVKADIYITTSGGDVLSSGTFCIEVERLPFSDKYGSYNEFKLFEGIIEELKENGGETFMTELVEGKQNRVLYGTSEPASTLGENGDVYIQTGTDQDYIVEQVLPSSGGSIGYRKWNSGYCEVFGYTSLSNVAITSAWQNLFYSGKQTIKIPVSLSFIYQGQISAENGEVWIMPKKIGKEQEEIYFVSAKSQTLSTAYLHIFITGKWK